MLLQLFLELAESAFAHKHNCGRGGISQAGRFTSSGKLAAGVMTGDKLYPARCQAAGQQEFQAAAAANADDTPGIIS